MYNKFDQIWDKLGIKDALVEKDCTNKLKKMAWTIFIVAKNKLCEGTFRLNMPGGNQNLMEYTLLILAVLHLVVLHSNCSSYIHEANPDVKI
jgi:hypothetical protein